MFKSQSFSGCHTIEKNWCQSIYQLISIDVKDVELRRIDLSKILATWVFSLAVLLASIFKILTVVSRKNTKKTLLLFFLI